MAKIWGVIVVVSIVVLLYLLMIIIMPIIVDLSVTANNTMDASVNMSLFPGTSDAMIAIPWILWFVPGTIGMFVVVMILKRP